MADGVVVLRPALPGAIVRFPGAPKRILKAEGEQVILNSYWTRRVRGGDVVEVYTNKQEEPK